MRPAAPRFLPFLAVALLTGCVVPAAESSERSPPTRPGAVRNPPAVAKDSPRPAAKSPVAAGKPKPRPDRARKTSLKTVASELGLKTAVDKNGQRIVLSDRTRRLELEVNSRETEINGLRFFLGEPVSVQRGVFYVDESDYRTCLVPLQRPARASRPPAPPKIVALDAGHGGNDRGTENPRFGLQEKTVNLDVTLRLKKLLEARGYKIVLTRDADERVENPLRAVIANRASVDLFVSIHFNSLGSDTKTSGAEVFTFTRQGQLSDEGRAQGVDDSEDAPARVNRYDQWNVAFASCLQRSLLSALKLPDRGHKTKHLSMQRGLDCPAALVESGFLSSEIEAKKIATPAYRQDIAEALAEGIENYAKLVESLRAKR
jgi:N-acetylmuramoyl-L-alanine amidase